MQTKKKQQGAYLYDHFIKKKINKGRNLSLASTLDS